MHSRILQDTELNNHSWQRGSQFLGTPEELAINGV